jgi:hypothetical protein
LYLKRLAGVLLGLLISICQFCLLFRVLRHSVLSLSPPGKFNCGRGWPVAWRQLFLVAIRRIYSE